ncbi:MAG: hypothetical protein ACE5GO_07230, partial [Anaerolineales bacterium]
DVRSARGAARNLPELLAKDTMDIENAVDHDAQGFFDDSREYGLGGIRKKTERGRPFRHDRVTKPGGMVIHCPGNNDRDNETHTYLVSQGFRWARFEEPEDGIKRKYWKTIRIPAPETQTRKLNR